MQRSREVCTTFVPCVEQTTQGDTDTGFVQRVSLSVQDRHYREAMSLTLNATADSVPAMLKTTRLVAGLTTRDIAPMVGVSHNTVSNWERGNGEPSVSQFVLWCHATNQAPEQMLQGLIEIVRPKGLEPLTF